MAAHNKHMSSTNLQ